MPTVYLPFGYPQLQGLEFANVIYQGEMVRLYTVPADPRNEAQIAQREIFADLARMRGTAGAFVRGVSRAALGSRWTGVFTQIVKAGVGAWWNDALDRFDGFADLAKDAWRLASLNQASYNDVGKMFYATVRTLSDAILFYGGSYWETQAWGEGDSVAAAAWWVRNVDQYKSLQDGSDATFIGSWVDGGGILTNYSAIGEWAEFYVVGAKFAIQNGPSGPAGYFDARSNGSLIGNYATGLTVKNWVPLPYRGLHKIRMTPTTSSISINYIYRG
jgi:hypothetical protein